MNASNREQIRQSLRLLVASYSATMELIERTTALICEEFALDPPDSGRSRRTREPRPRTDLRPVVDHEHMAVVFQGKTCFLGNTLPFKVLVHLIQQPNVLHSHADLLASVWNGVRSSDAVRSVVKVLRTKLRSSGLGDLADAIDGSGRRVQPRTLGQSLSGTMPPH